MKVCMVVPYDLAEEGGVKRHAYQLAGALRRLGDEVIVMGASSTRQTDPQIQGFGGILNIRSNGSDNHLAMLTPPWRIQRWLREHAFDVVHVHEPLAPMLAPWASLFAAPAARIATFHAFAEHEARLPKLLRWWSGPIVLRGFTRAIAVSRPAAEYARFVWKRPLAVIPNGIPVSQFAGAAARESSGDPVRLLFIGHWRDERKGLPVLLAAFAQLRARGVSVTLDVVGKGPSGTPPPVIPGVQFHGSVSTEGGIAAHLAACDIFVSPAIGQESFGIVLLEAMASGRPIVCSDIAGYREVVTSEHARLVAPGAPDALAEAIAGLVAAPVERRAIGARNRRAVAVYDWDALVHRVRDEYVEAIAENAGRRSVTLTG